ncbi:MAG: GAF domain-containing protein, partial [Thermodesulfobacteriota bacterium]|nr:GAF domain-containing protein [Thermodesulfobacteriota bacterium]
RRTEDKAREEILNLWARKLQSLLELGRIIGQDLQLKEMLLQIAQKACEVMEADRCSLFLHDPNTDDLWSTVALGMGEQVIRMPSRVGIAGYCFQTGATVNLEEAHLDLRFNRDVDAQTGYHTQSLLCMPLYNKTGERLGAVQLLNKKGGVFTSEDEAFLKIFGNHVSVFIEMAQLQKAKMDALEESKRELERLNQAKSKALDHLSHELRTPLSVIKGNIWILKRKLQTQTPPVEGEKFFKALEKHLNRLLDIQKETDEIVRAYQGGEGDSLNDELEHLWRKIEGSLEMPIDIKGHWDILKGWIEDHSIDRQPTMEFISLSSFVAQILEKVKQRASHRDIHFDLEGFNGQHIFMDPAFFEEVVEGLLKNAVENTPDEGMIRILLEPQG